MRARWELLFIPPFCVSFFLLTVTQIGFLRTSFFEDFRFGRVGTQFQFDNYVRILQDPFYLQSLGVTFYVSAVATAFALVFAYPIAYVIARMRSQWAMVLLATVVLSSFVTVPIKVLGLMIIFSPEGQLNRILLSLGFINEPFTILGNRLGVIVGLMHYTLAFAVLLLYSVIQTIPRSLEEAAQIHGVGRWCVFRRVVFPLSLPGVIAVTLIVFNLNMGGFTSAALLGGGKVLTLPVLIQRVIFLETKYAMAGALAAVLLGSVLLANFLSVFLARRFQRTWFFIRAAGSVAAACGPSATQECVSTPRLFSSFHSIDDWSRATSYQVRTSFMKIADSIRRSGLRVSAWHSLAILWMIWVYVFLLAPLVVIGAASLNGGPRRLPFVNFPPAQISLDWYWDIPLYLIRGLAVSLGLGFSASIIACVLALPAGLGLVRGRVPAKEAIAAFYRAPLQIPFVVIGLAFLQTYYLFQDYSGWSIVGSFVGLVIAHIFVLSPYVVGSVTAVLQRFDDRLEEAALILGATRWRTFRRVTLPLIMPGLYAGALYGFMVSFGDVPITLFLAAPTFTTFPVELFNAMQMDFDGALLASSTLVVVFAFGVVLLIQRIVGLNTILRAGSGG